VAGALSQSFPAAAPFFYLVAVLVGVARLYDRSHFVTDVIAGGVLGSVTGVLIARLLPGARGAALPGRRVRWAWVLPIAVAIPALAFFTAYERGIAAHRLRAPSLPANPQRDVVVFFGTPEARPLLRQGWSEDGRWGTMPMVWAEGLSATLRVPPLLPADHRVRLKVRPHTRGSGRPPCQVVEVALNGVPLARLLLERGWNDYELRVPKRAIRRGENELGFRFAYAEAEAAGAGRREFSAAFASLEAFVEDARSR
jgi:hypothetical protein